MRTRPPYSRTERLIALGRVPLAAGALVIAWHAGTSPFETAALRALFGAYLACSIALVPILSPTVVPATWWPLTTQAADLLVVGIAMILGTGATSPFFSCLLSRDWWPRGSRSPRLDGEDRRHREMGPRSLRHRVATLGGSLTIDSSPRGVRLEIHIPS